MHFTARWDSVQPPSANVICDPLKKYGAMEYKGIVLLPLDRIHQGCAIVYNLSRYTIGRNYFMEEGRDVLIVYDDLPPTTPRTYRRLLLLRHPGT